MGVGKLSSCRRVKWSLPLKAPPSSVGTVRGVYRLSSANGCIFRGDWLSCSPRDVQYDEGSWQSYNGRKIALCICGFREQDRHRDNRVARDIIQQPHNRPYPPPVSNTENTIQQSSNPAFPISPHPPSTIRALSAKWYDSAAPSLPVEPSNAVRREGFKGDIGSRPVIRSNRSLLSSGRVSNLPTTPYQHAKERDGGSTGF